MSKLEKTAGKHPTFHVQQDQVEHRLILVVILQQIFIFAVGGILYTFVKIKFIMAHILLCYFACSLIFDLISKLIMKAANLCYTIVFILLEGVNEILNCELDHEE